MRLFKSISNLKRVYVIKNGEVKECVLWGKREDNYYVLIIVEDAERLVYPRRSIYPTREEALESIKEQTKKPKTVSRNYIPTKPIRNYVICEQCGSVTLEGTACDCRRMA